MSSATVDRRLLRNPNWGLFLTNTASALSPTSDLSRSYSNLLLFASFASLPEPSKSDDILAAIESVPPSSLVVVLVFLLDVHHCLCARIRSLCHSRVSSIERLQSWRQEYTAQSRDGREHRSLPFDTSVWIKGTHAGDWGEAAKRRLLLLLCIKGRRRSMFCCGGDSFHPARRIVNLMRSSIFDLSLKSIDPVVLALQYVSPASQSAEE
ncbi:hypothetical protein DFH11DRAFT_612948 [Phellopilus nigrolimitatus]|nr:hypothetical protein DFH11DRAFT_612948 [Phellopilus nigrolimitatus]